MKETMMTKFNEMELEGQLFDDIKRWYYIIRAKANTNIEQSEVAAQLGVCEKTLNRWLTRKTMPRATQFRMLQELAARYAHHGSGDAA